MVIPLGIIMEYIGGYVGRQIKIGEEEMARLREINIKEINKLY